MPQLGGEYHLRQSEEKVNMEVLTLGKLKMSQNEIIDEQ